MNSMWRLMSQRELQVDPHSTCDDSKCSICNKLMIDACLSTCGCQYCHKCICDYLDGKDKYCPGGQQDCSEDFLRIERDVIKNMRMNNKISKLKVLCPNGNCQSAVELIQMEDHLRVCSKEGAECPYVTIGCDNEDTSKDMVLDHLQNGTFTHSHLLMEYIHNLRNEVDGLKNDLSVSQGIITTTREEMREKIEQMKSKMKEERNEESAKGEKMITRLKEELLEVMESKIKLIPMTMKDTEGLEKTSLGIRRESVGDIRSERKEESKKDGGDAQERINAILTACLGMDVDYAWVIDDYSRKMEIMNESRIFSETFYSNNYKLCLSMCNGFEGIVELYCIIMRGERDDKAQWPMKKYITLSLLNQDTLETHWSGKVQYDTYIHKSAFVKPKGNINDYGIGVKLPKYSTFKNNSSVVVNGTIIITCVLSDR